MSAENFPAARLAALRILARCDTPAARNTSPLWAVHATPPSLAAIREPYVPPAPVVAPIRKIRWSRQMPVTRYALWKASDYLCGICRGPIRNLEDVTYDHVVPRAAGGRDARNLVAAHSACNGEKADRAPTPSELAFLAMVNARLAE